MSALARASRRGKASCSSSKDECARPRRTTRARWVSAVKGVGAHLADRAPAQRGQDVLVEPAKPCVRAGRPDSQALRPANKLMSQGSPPMRTGAAYARRASAETTRARRRACGALSSRGVDDAGRSMLYQRARRIGRQGKTEVGLCQRGVFTSLRVIGQAAHGHGATATRHGPRLRAGAAGKPESRQGLVSLHGLVHQRPAKGPTGLARKSCPITEPSVDRPGRPSVDVQARDDVRPGSLTGPRA